MGSLKEFIYQTGLALIVCASSLWCALAFAAETSDSQSYCTQQELALQFSGPHVTITPDYSCLVGFSEIADALSDYQLIDARATGAPPLAGSWKMAASELRHKSFLKSKSLLIVNEDFGLAEMARDCALLLDAGFTVKFAAGSGWYDYFSITDDKKVSAKEIFKEYHLGKLVLIAISEAVSTKLNSIGLVDHHTVKSQSDQKISSITLAHSENGLVPVVLVGDYQETINVSDLHLPNIYSVEGGVNALGVYYRDMQLSLAGKRDRQSRRMCGKI